MFQNSVTNQINYFNFLSRLTHNQIYLLAGMSLILLYMTQLLLGYRWEWLDTVQNDEFYRQFTGFLLLTYVLMQSKLGIQRLRKHNISHRKAFDHHKIQGVFGPIIFYIHSIDAGFAYQVILTFAFLGNCIIGYLSPQSIPWRNKIYVYSWTIVHISLAILTLVLMLFHTFVVYYYS